MITTNYNLLEMKFSIPLIKEYLTYKRLHKDFYIEDVFTSYSDTFVTCEYWSNADGQWDQQTYCIEPEHWNDWLAIRREGIISDILEMKFSIPLLEK